MGVAARTLLNLKRQTLHARRMSVWPVAIETLTPLGTEIIAATTPSRPVSAAVSTSAQTMILSPSARTTSIWPAASGQRPPTQALTQSSRPELVSRRSAQMVLATTLQKSIFEFHTLISELALPFDGLYPFKEIGRRRLGTWLVVATWQRSCAFTSCATPWRTLARAIAASSPPSLPPPLPRTTRRPPRRNGEGSPTSYTFEVGNNAARRPWLWR